MVGLLFFLLEHLSIRQDFSSSHGISLPTDEFDCSRTLAHMVLFPHDDAIVQLVGEDRYVRWMDDQNMAVDSKAEGLLVLKETGKSLGRLHLTPNGQKSKILSLVEARRHYHLDLNKDLDQAEVLSKAAGKSKNALVRFQRSVRRIWRAARAHEGIGEFSKVLKRIYRLAGLAGLGLLRSRAVSDILADPSLVERISDYYRCTGTIADYLDFADVMMNHPEQVYPDVNVAIANSLLRLEPTQTEINRIRGIAKTLISRKQAIPGAEDCASAGALLALRFGDQSLLRVLKTCFEDKKQVGSTAIVRACAFVYASRSDQAFTEVRMVASSVLRNHLSTLVRLIDEIRGYSVVPARYGQRMSLSMDSVAGRKFVDMRVVLTARLLLLNPSASVRDWVIAWRDRTIKEDISAYDRRLLRRLVKA
jgi:hypothetical protein